MHEDLGLVVDHVDCSVFLIHLKLENTVERLPSRHLALSLFREDIKAQCDSLTYHTRERLQGILSQREVDISTNVSLAHEHGYLKISRNPFLRVHRDIPVRSETIHEPETDPFSGPADPSDSVTGELDFDSSVSKTRKRRRLLHKSLVSARFSLDDCDEDDDISAQTHCFVPLLPKILMRNDLLSERFALLVLKVIHLLLSWKQLFKPTKLNLRDSSTSSSSSRKGVLMPS